MQRYIRLRDFDWVLLAFVLAICAVGVLEIYSATLHTKFVGAHIRQVYWIIGGLAVMFVMSRINYQVLLENTPWMYIVSLASLLAVLAIGQTYLGAKRWIRTFPRVFARPAVKSNCTTAACRIYCQRLGMSCRRRT